jgi:hypothetical protein
VAGMNRRTLFTVIAGLFCTKAKAEEPKMRVYLQMMQNGVVEKEWAWEEGCKSRQYFRCRFDNTWSRDWGSE